MPNRARRRVPYAVIHATAAAAYQTWRPEGFLAAAEYLERDRDLETVFIGSAGDVMAAMEQLR